MTYIVSITKQGQISIPIELRRKFGLDKTKRAVIYPSENGSMVLKPVRDILSYYGAFKTNKKFSPKKVREDFGNYMASHHLK